MRGFTVFGILCCLSLLGVVTLPGCEESPATPEPAEETAAERGCDFNPATAGMIRGQVTWQGAIPQIASYRAPLSPGNERPKQALHNWPNPHTPRINPETKAIAGAVVFLRGVDPRRARPWDHPAVRIELRDYQIHVLQGERDGDVGFVRRGDAIQMLSQQPIYHSLKARGAAFFARAFADTNQPCVQRLDQTGLVELSSGCGYFWMRACLFVDDHPYYTQSDAAGYFTLPQVPPGNYELVCWLPDWHEELRELDAETALICRLTFRPAVQITQAVALTPQQTCTTPVVVPAERFGR